MQRSFRYFAIVAGGTPQPLVGTNLAASVAAGSQVYCTVGSTVNFLKGDLVRLIATDGSNSENAYVFSVVDATHIIVDKLAAAHTGGVAGTGEWICLAITINSIYVQGVDGNGGALFIGTTPAMVKATGVGVIAKLVNVGVGVQPTELASSRSGAVNADNLGQLFIDGTTADSYLPSVGVI